MNNLLRLELDNSKEFSVFLQDIFGERCHIIIRDSDGNVIFNPSKFDLSQNVRIIEINGDEIANINNKFYKIETNRMEQQGNCFDIIRIIDYTNIMEAIKILQNDDKTGALRPEQFSREISSLRRDLKKNNIPFCLVMIDIDNFKLINDSYGHVYGDNVLRETAKILSMVLRKEDAIGRFGGDEFILAISQAKGDEVKELFRERVFPRLKNELKINISAGIKEYDEAISYEENKNMADIALYFAKQKGKGRIINYENWMIKEVFKPKQH